MQDVICKQCGSINDFNVVEGTHRTAYCNGCNAYIKHLPKPNKEHVIYFGKFKGTKLADFTTRDHVSWLQWAVKNCQLQDDLKDAIIKHLG